MKIQTKDVVFAAVAWLASIAANAQTLFNSPVEYFGGKDNAPYVDWVNGIDQSSKYGSSVFLSSDSADDSRGTAVHWKVEEDFLYVVVAARATGWLAFGISETGGMPGSDVATFRADQPDELVDSYMTDNLGVFTDTCQNWQLLSSSVSDGFLMFEARRPLDTADNQDHLLINDVSEIVPPTRIIAAWGDTQAVGYHGVNRARGSVRFFGNGSVEMASFHKAMEEQADGYFEIRAVDYEIPAVDTEYKDFCLTWEDILVQGVPEVEGLTIVGFEPIVDQDAARHVHHFTLMGDARTMNNETCKGGFEEVFDLTYAWAPGEPAMSLPTNVGLALGPGAGVFSSLKLEIHYDNPGLVTGAVDSSGVRLYYSTEPRQYQLGMFQVGDLLVSLEDELVGEGLIEHRFQCSESCTNAVLVNDSITVLREHLHMHQSGVRMYNEQIRNNEVVRMGSIEYFLFNQQGNPAVQQGPYEILPGDSFNTVCHYRSESDEVFGLSSQNEMCIAFLFYYPRKAIQPGVPFFCGPNEFIPQCNSSHETSTMSSESDLNRVFGLSSDQCQDTISNTNVSTSGEATNRVLWVLTITGAGAVALFLI